MSVFLSPLQVTLLAVHTHGEALYLPSTNMTASNGEMYGCTYGSSLVLACVSFRHRCMDGPPLCSSMEKAKKGEPAPPQIEGAHAIVLSGGYVDDADQGTEFWYTGEGGQQKGMQVKDQTWTGGNLALRRNMETGKPVSA